MEMLPSQGYKRRLLKKPQSIKGTSGFLMAWTIDSFNKVRRIYGKKGIKHVFIRGLQKDNINN